MLPPKSFASTTVTADLAGSRAVTHEKIAANGISGHRGLRIPLRLPHRRPRRPRRDGRVAVHAALRLAGGVRHGPGPRWRRLSPRPLRREPPSGAALPARDDGPGDHV